VRVELKVNLSPERCPASPARPPDRQTREAAASLDRENRRLKRIALARVVARAISDGDFIDMADLARRCGVSRARLSNVVGSLYQVDGR
jgi:hypothetical protein